MVEKFEIQIVTYTYGNQSLITTRLTREKGHLMPERVFAREEGQKERRQKLYWELQKILNQRNKIDYTKLKK